MSVTPYDPPRPPKTITKIQEDEYLDFTSPFTWVLMGFVGFALFIRHSADSLRKIVFLLLSFFVFTT